MFNLSDRVRHKQTGDIGIVIGYGYRLVQGNYLTTVKVRITRSNNTRLGVIVEDVFSKWLFHKERTYCLFELPQNAYFEAA